MTWLLVVGVIVSIFLIVHLIGIYRLASFKLMSGNIEPIRLDEVSEEQLHVLKEAEELVKEHGFEFKSYVKRASVIVGHPWGLYGAVCYNDKTNTWALVYVEPAKQFGFEWRLILISRDEVPNFIVTTSGCEFDDCSCPDGYQIKDAMTISHLDQLTFHDDRLGHVSSNNEFDIETALTAFEMIFFQGLVEMNVVVPWKDGYRLPLKQSISVWRKFMSINKTLKQQLPSPNIEGHEGDDRSKLLDTPARQLTEYQSYKSIKEKQQTGWVAKTLILLASVVLFSVSFGMSFSIDWLLMLIVALFIHEAGHLFGMWIYGYKDLRMLFIPFMGAMAIGKKEKVSSFQEAIILLLGPLPGYVLGVVLLSIDSAGMPEWVQQYAIMSLLLNAINLLPFNPLDGGKIVSLALFNRLPMLQLMLTLISILALGYMGLEWDENVALIIAVVLVIALPFTWKETQLLRHLIRSGIHKNKNTSLAYLIESLASHPVWIKQLPSNRWPLLDSLVYRVQHASSGLFTSLLIFILWVGTIVLPPGLLASDYQKDLFISVAADMLFDASGTYSVDGMVEQYEAADTDKLRAEAALNLSSRLHYEDKERGVFYWEQVSILVRDGDLTLEERGDIYMRMGYSCRSYTEDCGNEYLLKAVNVYEQGNVISRNRAWVYLNLANEKSLDDTSRLSYADKGEGIMLKIVGTNNLLYELNTARSLIYEKKGMVSEAEQYLQRNIQYTSDKDTMFHRTSHKALANFYVRQGEKAKATDLLKGYKQLARPSDPEWVTIHDKMDYWLAWLLIDSEPSTAKDHLEYLDPKKSFERIELILANIIVDEALNNGSSNEQLNKLSQVVDDMEGVHELAMLFNNLEANDERFGFDGMDSDMHGNDISKNWYSRVGDLIHKPEYSFLLAKLNEYKEEFAY